MSIASSTELQVILDRVRAGDVRARDELIVRAYERLRRLAAKMLQDFPKLEAQQSSHDLLHDVFPRLRRALEAVPPITVRDFIPLAALQIRRQLLDAARSQCGRIGKTVSLTSFIAGSEAAAGDHAEPAASTYDPATLARWCEFHERAGALPDAERAVFDLLYYGGYEQAEAAELLGISVATIKRRWTAARLQLSELLLD